MSDLPQILELARSEARASSRRLRPRQLRPLSQRAQDPNASVRMQARREVLQTMDEQSPARLMRDLGRGAAGAAAETALTLNPDTTSIPRLRAAGELGMELTGLPSVRRGATALTDPLGDKTQGAIDLGLGALGAATLQLGAGRGAAPRVPQPAPQIIGAVSRQAAPAGRRIVYHGSPHEFERFDMGRLGTGEGAQAFGPGLYVADSPAVGRAYREQLAGPGKGRMYEVDIPDGPYIDTDMQFGQLPRAAQEAMAEIYGMPLRKIPRTASVRVVNAEEAQRLSQRGFRGIQYLDQGSRGNNGGTRNYVMFNDSDLNVRGWEPGSAPPPSASMFSPNSVNRTPEVAAARAARGEEGWEPAGLFDWLGKKKQTGEPPPRLTREPTQLGTQAQGILPIAPRREFTTSMRGGSDDLADAAGMKRTDDVSGPAMPQRLTARDPGPITGPNTRNRIPEYRAAKLAAGEEGWRPQGPGRTRGAGAERGAEAFSDSRLTAPQNKAVEMARNNFSNGEIAEELETTTTVVAQHLSRARSFGINIEPGHLPGRVGHGGWSTPELYEMRQRGLSSEQIAERTGVDPASVKSRIAQEARRRGVEPGYRPADDDEVRQMWALRDEGLSQTEIAARVGRHQTYVSKILRRPRPADDVSLSRAPRDK